jgi:uncharacterized protein (TIGR02611 family)
MAKPYAPDSKRMITKFTEWLKLVLKTLPHPIRWTMVVIIGIIFIIAGIIMLVLPGPGWLFIFLGFGILSIEFTWAYEVVKSGEQWMEKIVRKVKFFFTRK